MNTAIKEIINSFGLTSVQIEDSVYSIQSDSKVDICMLGDALRPCLVISGTDVEWDKSNNGRSIELTRVYYIIASEKADVKQSYVQAAKTEFKDISVRSFTPNYKSDFSLPIYREDEVSKCYTK